MCDPVSIGVAVSAAVSVGTAVYSADQTRKAQHKTADAEAAAQQDDARQAAELDTSTALTANAKFAAGRRAQQANVLALGGATGALGGDTGASPGTAGLGSGQSTTAGPVSVLGSGSPGGGYVPRQQDGGSSNSGTGGGTGGGGSPRQPRAYVSPF